MMDETIYKIAIAAFLHDIGKFAERAHGKVAETDKLSPAFFPDEKFLNDNMDLYQPHFKGKYTHKHALYTAAFIDHIEKILPGNFNRNKWGMGDSFINLAAGHHNPTTAMQWIIAMADRISSGFERTEFEYYNHEIDVKDYKRTRLLPIFENISYDDKQRKKEDIDSYQFRYPLQEINPLSIFPVEKNEYKRLNNVDLSEEYKALFFGFISSLEKLIHQNNILLWFEHFDSLFMLYASHIPSATVGKVVPDTSLYDHSKMTAALASALYLYHLHNNSIDIEKIRSCKEKKFLMITGNFYGIQNFIFSGGGSTGKASAKLLRGRSFTVSLFSELAADMLCREIGLTPASIVFNAAGKFTIIAPNTDATKKAIGFVQEKINAWLIKIFMGESTLGISYIEASAEDFSVSHFNELWERLSKESESNKYHKFDLNRYGGAINEYLDQFNNDLNNKLCPFCGKRPSCIEVENDPVLGSEKSACTLCRDHIFIGTHIVRDKRIAITIPCSDLHGEKLKEPLFGIYQVSFDVTGKLMELVEQGVLLKYWDISIPSVEHTAKDITAKFINGYVPRYTEEDNYDNRYLDGKQSEETRFELIEAIKVRSPKTFLHIAKKAKNLTDQPHKFSGIEALGILKADVDNLGLIFSFGLEYPNLTRTATLSRQLNNFFSIYVPYILSTHDEYQNIYTVFAGGDDLFLIGPWNSIINFAQFLNEKFSQFVCCNKQITLSAGISINKSNEPVFVLSERAEEALKNAKSNNRNSITLFEESVTWQEFYKLQNIKKTFEEWLENMYINNAMLFRMNTYAHMAKKENKLRALFEKGCTIEFDELACFKWRAMFKYNLVRNIGRHLKGDIKETAINEVEKAALWLTQFGGAIKIPLWQIIYNNR